MELWRGDPDCVDAPTEYIVNLYSLNRAVLLPSGFSVTRQRFTGLIVPPVAVVYKPPIVPVSELFLPQIPLSLRALPTCNTANLCYIQFLQNQQLPLQLWLPLPPR
jgi:hypothetical protein